MGWEREGRCAGALGRAGDSDGVVCVAPVRVSSPVCWGMELPGWAVLADVDVCGTAVTRLSVVSWADGNAGLMLRRGAGDWGCRVESHHRGGVFEAIGKNVILLDGSIDGMKREVSRAPTLWGKEGRGGEGVSRAVVGGSGGGCKCRGPHSYIWARAAQTHLQRPLLTGLHTPSESRGLILATQAQDMAESDSTRPPFRVNICTTSGSGLLFQAGRNNLLVASVELKMLLKKKPGKV